MIAASPSLKRRLADLPFPVEFLPEPPLTTSPANLLFFSFPAGLPFADNLPPAARFIGTGEGSFLGAAFARGALDYLKEPWDRDELVVRVERLLLPFSLQLGGSGIRLDGCLLRSDLAETALSGKEANVLRELILMQGGRVPRALLLQTFWPESPDNSRALDEAVARLRHALSLLRCGGKTPQIRSVRGFGYRLIL